MIIYVEGCANQRAGLLIERMALSLNVYYTKIKMFLKLFQQYQDLMTIIMLLGTTGNPKGVMLTADNITWTVRQARVCRLC